MRPPLSFRFLVFAPILLFGPAGIAASGQQHNDAHLAAPIELRCDGREEPVTVEDGKPELSWKVMAAEETLHGVRQSSYQVRIARWDADLAGAGSLVWDSGKQGSAVTRLLPERSYAGNLAAGQEYSWQVRVWDENDHPSPWSRPAHWTQGPSWHAEWIAAGSDEGAGMSRPMPLLRKEIGVSGDVRRALLYVSGPGQYEFRINGSKVGARELTPGWSDDRKTVFYDTFDVTRLLRRGTNALGVLLGNGMYRVLETPGRYTKFTGSLGPPQCIVQLEIVLRSGQTLTFVSDRTWKGHPGPITFSSTYGGEDYDARLEPAGWDESGFDENAWTPVRVMDGPGGALRAELSPPIRGMHTYQAVRRSQPKPGIVVYDLGQNIAGWPSIEVIGNAGTTVKLIPGELLKGDGTVSQQSSGGPQWFSYTLKGRGREKWHPRFSYYGFRYVQVEGAADDDMRGARGRPETPRLLSLVGEAVHTSSSAIGSFSSSDNLLNRIHSLILHAIENNAESLFTDCPHREKLGWLEETHLMASSMLYDFDFTGLYAATARNIADAQTQEGPGAGRIPEIAPQYVLFEPQWGVFDDSPEWGSAAVLAPWYVYQRNGDLNALLSQLQVMRRYVDYLGTRAQDGIVAYGLGDWYDIGPGEPGISKLTSPGVTATAIYYQDLRVLEAVLALAGRTAESADLCRKAGAVRQSFNLRFFDRTQHRYDKGSQTAQAMPLVVGLVPEEEKAAVLATLVADIRGRGNHVTAGDVGYHYVVDALLGGNRADVLYDMMKRTDSPSYGYQLAQGATSLTEAWDANPNSSQDHFMLGDAEEWFYRGLGGIGVDLSAKAPRRLTIAPQVVGNLAWVRTSYNSVWGVVESSFTRDPRGTSYLIRIPANTQATVSLNTSNPNTVSVNGKRPGDAAGVAKATNSDNRIELIVDSGTYRIWAPNLAENIKAATRLSHRW